jgi:hypothetical protein
MNSDSDISIFLAGYDPSITTRAQALRAVLKENLPAVTEEYDIKARMIAYIYGPRYADVICVLLPSQKGLKLGFNRGISLADSHSELEGAGKISRYLVIRNVEQLHTPEFQKLIADALACYRQLV